MPRFPVVYAPGGVDYRLPETLRDTRSAIDGLNFDITPNLALVKRTGFQGRATDAGGYGLVVHEARESVSTNNPGFGSLEFGVDPFGSPSTLGLGTIRPTLITIDETPSKWVEGTMSITYSGAGTAVVTIKANSSGTRELLLIENNTTVLTKDLGTGYESSGVVTMSGTASAISAVTNFTASVTDTNSTPAAFMDPKNAKSLPSATPVEIGFGYWEALNHTSSTTPLANFKNKIGEPNFENPSAVTLNGVLYISTGYDDLHKYDGQTLYLAGLPRPPAGPSVASGTSAAASGFSGAYKYQYQYKQIDNVLNVAEGRVSLESATINNASGGKQIDVTLTNLTAGSGYNTGCGICTGGGASSNSGTNKEVITVDDGSSGTHTFKVGDTAYFYDVGSSAYVTYNIIATGSTTITIDAPSTVTLSSGAVISNNLRIEIWRTSAGGSTFSLVEEVPNNSFASTQTYTDNTPDASLGANFSTPDKTPATPPRGKYISVWQNQLVISGDPTSPTTQYYSELDTTTGVEDWPIVNTFEAASDRRGGEVTGMQTLIDELIIFTAKRTFNVTGTLASDDVTVQIALDNIGCVAHHTIQEDAKSLIFLSQQGVMQMQPGQFRQYQATPLSMPIDPVWKDGANNNFERHEKRSIAVLSPQSRRYLLFAPDATLLGGEWYANSGSRVFAYDLDLGQWYPWSNLNMIGGAVFWEDYNDDSDETIWFHSRENVNNSVQCRLYKFNDTDSEIDYIDHVSAVDMNYRPQWEFANAPKSRKIYNEMSIDAYLKRSQLAYTPTGTINVDIYRDFNPDTSEASFTVDYLANDQEIIKGLPWTVRRSLGLKFSNSEINKQILIHGWGFEALDFRQDMRR